MRKIVKSMNEKYQSNKENLKSKLSTIINGFFDYLLIKGSTSIGLKLRELVSSSYIKENEGIESEFNFQQYMYKLNNFYKWEIDGFCKSNGLNKIEELILRKKEINNKNSYLSNVGIAIGTGFLTGLLVNNISKLAFLFGDFEKSLLEGFIRFLSFIILMLISATIPFVIVIIFKKFITINNPLIEYSKEIELQIIDKILLNWDYTLKE